MANRKISEFTALTAPASGDTFAILDVDASGIEVNKKITYANVLGKAPDGTAAAPAFSFNSDTNSGISGGSDTLVLSTGGTAAISVDSSQNVTLSANLTVSGTTTTIDTTTLTVKDKNIEIAKGNGNDAAVDGAGITIDSTDGDKTWNWVDSTDAWTSSEHIHLGDNKKLLVGTGSDLEIFHNGSQSKIIDVNGNELRLQADTIRFRDKDDGDTYANFIHDGAVELFYDNSKKLETTSAGVDVTGNITVSGTVDGIDIATDVAANTAKVTNATHTGEVTGATALTIADNVVDEANLKVSNSPTNGYYLQAQSGNTGGLTWAAVAQYTTPLTTQGDILYRDGSGDQRLAAGTSGYFLKTQGSGADPVWAAVPAGVGGASGVDFNDDVKARWGTGNDLEIYHDGTDNYWQTGAITTHFRVNSGNRLTLKSDGNVQMQGSSGKNLEWVTASGSLTFADSAKATFGTGNDLQLYHDGTDSYVHNDNGSGWLRMQGDAIALRTKTDTETYLTCSHNGGVELYYDNSKKLETTSDGATVSGSLKVEDDNKIKVGTGADLQLYHNGTDSFIKNFTGITRVLADDFRVLNQANDEVQIKAVADGAVSLYHNGTTKLETTSWGSQITGNLVATGLIDLSDGNGTSTSTIALGDSDDLKIYHDGSHSYIKDAGTGNLVIQTNILGIQAANGLEDVAKFTENAAVELYYDNSKKFETTSTGATVTGVATVSNGIIETAITIATNHTITTNYNAMSTGPVTVSATVTVPSGSVWTVI